MMEGLIEEGLYVETVSLDSATYEDETGETCALKDMIPDPDSSFDDKLILSIDLSNALKSLTPDEISVIERIYLSEYAVSELASARESGIPRSTLESRRIKILEKLRKIIVNS